VVPIYISDLIQKNVKGTLYQLNNSLTFLIFYTGGNDKLKCTYGHDASFSPNLSYLQLVLSALYYKLTNSNFS